MNVTKSLDSIITHLEFLGYTIIREEKIIRARQEFGDFMTAWDRDFGIMLQKKALLAYLK